MQYIDLEIYLHQLLFGHLRPYQLNGRYAHLWVQLGHVWPAASADSLLHLLLPFVHSMPKHLVQNHETMRAILWPIALELQEQLHIHGLPQLSDWPVLLSGSFLCHLEFLSFANVSGYHQPVITTGKQRNK